MMKAGDTAYLVYDDTRKDPLNVTIKSIGRKYITIDGVHSSESRYDILTKRSADDASGWNCRATLYESCEQYHQARYEKLVTNELRLRIIARLQYSLVADGTIRDIANLLCIEI